MTFNGLVKLATPHKLVIKKKLIPKQARVPSINWHPESILSLTPQTPVLTKAAAEHSEPTKTATAPPTLPDAGKTILSRSPKHYTIQLIGSFDMSVIKEFIDTNSVTNPKVIHIRSQGKPWYMLLYGDYSTNIEAQQALGALPSTMKVEGPWIRQYANVQASMRR